MDWTSLGAYELIISDITGRVVYRQDIDIVMSEQQMRTSIDMLDRGLHFVRIVADDKAVIETNKIFIH